MKRFWFGAFLLFLLLLGVYSWFAIAPVDLHSQIEQYILAPSLIAFAVGMLAFCYGQGCADVGGALMWWTAPAPGIDVP